MAVMSCGFLQQDVEFGEKAPDMPFLNVNKITHHYWQKYQLIFIYLLVKMVILR